MANNNNGDGAFIVGFVIGALVGAAVALIMAPQSGEETRAKIMSKPDVEPVALPEATDEHGVANPKARRGRLQAKWSGFFYKDNVPLPSDEELSAAQSHIEHELSDAVDAGSQAAAEIAGQQPH